MWRAAAAVDAEVLVFLDADSHDFKASFLIGLLGPLLLDPDLQLVKGSFERPLALGAGRGSPAKAAGSPSWSRDRC